MGHYRFSFSTNAFVRFPLHEALGMIKEAGFEGAEILADAPHAYLGRAGAGQIRRLAARLKEINLSASSLNANTACGFFRDAPPEPFFEPSIISPNPKWRRWRIEYTKKALSAAAELGAPSVAITTGRPMGDSRPEIARRYLREALDEILPEARRLGVGLGIEYEPGLLIERADELLELLEEVDDPNLGANLDIGHAKIAGEDILDAMEKLAGRIFNLHIEDIKGGKHYHLLPGEGEIDFAAILKKLDEINYKGWLTWELYTYQSEPMRAARAAAEFGRKLLAANGEGGAFLT